MKRLYLLLVILLVASMAITSVSCKKGQATTDTSQGEATLARIMNFKQQVDYYKANPAIKDGESVTLDEAIWNIEALFNLTYSYPDLSYGRTETADTVLYLPIGSDNTVLLTDLTVFYGQMYEVISGIYHGIELDNKQFIILDVELGERHGNQQAIRLQSVQGSVKGIQPLTPPIPQPVIWAPFADGPDWCYGEKLGRRDGSLYLEMDATDTLSSMLNAILLPKAPSGQEYIYPVVMSKGLPSFLHLPYSHNFYEGEYCEFYKENATDDDKWLSTSQMNFQYYGERHLVLNVLPDYDDEVYDPVPSDFELINVHIESHKSDDGQNLTYWHHTIATYGLRETLYHNIIVKGNL